MNNQRISPKGMRVFSTIWFGQLISTLGSGLTGFALGVWIYENTGSTTLFAFNMVAYSLPTLIMSPFAGALVDRWNRRWVMILSDSGAGLSTLAIWLLLLSGRLEVWHIYVATAINAAFTSFQWPAYSAATTMLVPKRHLGRSGGMVQIGEAISQLISPAVAGALFVTTGLKGIILIDFVTFAFAVFTLAIVRIPQPKETEVGKEARGSLLSEAIYGWKYIRVRPGLLGLLLFFAAINFNSGFLGVLLIPMLLDMAEPDTIGIVFSVIGVGMLLGTILMSAWGGPKRRIIGVLFPAGMAGFFSIFLGLRPSLPLITLSGFGFMVMLPIINGSSQALWQTKVAADLQGRVFAVRRMIAQSIQPISMLLAGPLADRVFEPLLVEGGSLSTTVGAFVGVGHGRGTALLFILLGSLVMLFSLLAYSHPRIRKVEDELPDATTETPDEPPYERTKEIETTPAS